MPDKRVSVYVDGFNLYHALDALGQNHLKWLNLWALSETLVREGEFVTAVKFFTAYAKWKTASYRRQQRYVAALQAHGVEVIEGRFKKKIFRCRGCNVQYTTHEEKETDVNIGVHLMADALKDRFDRALVISADTDLNSAVTLARNETTGKLIDVVAPPGRMNRNTTAMFSISKGKLQRSLLPVTVTHDGQTINRPSMYDPP